MVRHAGHRIHSILVSRFPVHRVRWSRFCSLQRHPSRQVLNTGTQLPDPCGNDSQPRRHLPDTRQTIVAVVLLVSPAAWSQFRHDLCFSADENEPDRPHPRRLEETFSHQEASIHVRCSSGVYLEPVLSHSTSCQLYYCVLEHRSNTLMHTYTGNRSINGLSCFVAFLIGWLVE